jgi:hypothetical protein
MIMFLYELINMVSIFLYTTFITFSFHHFYHMLKSYNREKLKNNFFYRLLFFNKQHSPLYKNNYSHNFIYDPLLSLVLWFCLISYLFFPFHYAHSLVYGIITLFTNFYLHAEFNFKRSMLKRNKFFLFFKKKHGMCHAKHDLVIDKYKRYKHLLKLLTKK